MNKNVSCNHNRPWAFVGGKGPFVETDKRAAERRGVAFIAAST